ncbi:hypothetical protein A7C99_4935 [Trichophyton rubrum]|uniref:F-box domain-containing protein n=1 Tax=Trichophyton rubrum TaxID=5551 RepID=A0A178EWU8_TRIRU|nr:hypothetical protein A7C99_4935 [Trichophyton rubrum]
MAELSDDEKLVQRLSHRPSHLVGGMIPITEPVKPSQANRRSEISSTGMLDRLPLEVLHQMLNTLDFQSLCRLSRVSRRGRSIVESLPTYRALMEYISDALKALGETRLIQLHSADKLRAVLQSEASKQSFGLTLRDLKKLPLVKTVPGMYDLARGWSHRGSQTLVSVRHAKEYAMKINNGSLPDVDTTITPEMSDRMIRKMIALRWFREAPLEPLPDNPSRIPTRGGMPDNDCNGMASLPFPSLRRNKTLEHGFCRLALLYILFLGAAAGALGSSAYCGKKSRRKPYLQQSKIFEQEARSNAVQGFKNDEALSSIQTLHRYNAKLDLVCTQYRISRGKDERHANQRHRNPRSFTSSYNYGVVTVTRG